MSDFFLIRGDENTIPEQFSRCHHVKQRHTSKILYGIRLYINEYI